MLVITKSYVTPGVNDLQTRYPNVAAEWHPTKNNGLTPSMVAARSHKKVWWQCKEGHEWQATITNRTLSGTGCPYCSRRLPISGETDLATLFPAIAKQWHPTKNDNLRPENVAAQSNKKVWWQCKEGHEWQAVICARTSIQGTDCPYCTHRIPVPGKTDLATLFPIIAKEWHPTKNDNLRPENVAAHSAKKVWWQCKEGHEWQATITNRTLSGTGCPYCSRHLPISGETDLATLFPDIAEQWHPTKNDNLRPENVAAQSNKKVWWQCKEGHEWQATIKNRTLSGTGCPYCSRRLPIPGETDLATLFPTIAEEWHPTKNRGMTPDKVTAKSSKNFWWRCEKGHEWVSTVYSRTRNNTPAECPRCSKIEQYKR